MKSAQFDVIVGGSLHLDIMVQSPLLPRVDETKIGSEWGMKCGGKGGNQAVMAAKTGVKTAMIGAVGDDDFGSRLLANLDHAGVDKDGVLVDPHHGSGMSVAIIQDDGEYGAVVVSGANKYLTPDTMQSRWTKLGGGRVLVLQNEIPEVANLALTDIAKKSGAIVILNSAPYRPMPSEFLNKVDFLILNRIEASEFFDQDIETIEEATKALENSTKNYNGHLLITLGRLGLVLSGPHLKPTGIPPVPVKAVSAHGAGDCFTGVFAAAIAHAMPILDAATYAAEAAAHYVAASEDERANLNFDINTAVSHSS